MLSRRNKGHLSAYPFHPKFSESCNFMKNPLRIQTIRAQLFRTSQFFTNVLIYLIYTICFITHIIILSYTVLCRRQTCCHVNTDRLTHLITLNLKTPRNPASENVACLCRLLNIPANFSKLFCIQANRVDPDQTEEQSYLGPHCLQKRLLKSQADDTADDNCCAWQFKG